MKILDTIERYKATINEMARPFTIYLSGIGLFLCAFLPASWSNSEAIWALAAVATGMGLARSFDKRTTVETRESTSTAPQPPSPEKRP